MAKFSGTCLCGKIKFHIDGEPDARMQLTCHCRDCQQLHGGPNAMAAVARDDLSIDGDVSWYRSSEKAQRGTCPTCSARIFKDNDGSDKMMVSMGAFDASTGLRPFKNIWTESKGDWYDLPPEEPPRF